MTTIDLSRRHLLRVSGLFLLVGVASCTTTPQMSSTPSDGEDETAAALPLVNQLRGKNGLTSLRADPAATAAALFQAKRMASAGKMKHVMGIADGFGPRVKASGVQLPAAENIAAGQQSVPAVVTAWINSPHHLENMLGRYSGLGVAVAHNSASRNVPYWAMVLSS
ncbi:CAP domain-containing protein [Rhizobium sp. P32RR-XVIII]|uniref:CAP domain-containing protein n=1 Tax=Rhizobium sp. P32RR-XVIII TaxID=2726738 RepID=UPI001456E9DD|nr:CAP domain-containing protein [Rhizobium sp. P32RR-XVIII]NLS02219.1 CAP domain-containing protein [Rhizobium sp. P32RR-XVIII]